MIKINCPICNYKKHKRIFSLGNRLFPVHVSICRNCGFVFRNPRCSEEEWLNYYLKDYDMYHRHLEDAFNITVTHPHKNAYEIFCRIREMSNVVSMQKVLDIGCGNGELLLGFSKLTGTSLQLFAIDPALESKRLLKEKGIKTIGNSVEDFDKIFLNTFDLVICRHTLEHAYNPLKFMKAIRDFPHEQGIIYVSIPDLCSAVDFPFCYPHISYFNRFTFTLLAQKACLKIRNLAEEGDEIYGIFQKSNELESGSSNQALNNFSSTCDFIRKNYRLSIKRSLKRIFSYLVPVSCLKKYILSKKG